MRKLLEEINKKEIVSNEIIVSNSECKFLELLDETELVKYNAIKTSFSKMKYLASRVFLRMVLSHASDKEISLSLWCFTRNDYGKPEISSRKTLPRLKFSISYSGSIIAVAISSKGSIGMDIEFLRSDIEIDSMGAVFSDIELDWLKNNTNREDSNDIIKVWTLKEAYSKMLGYGLSMDFKSFSVGLDPLCLIKSGNCKDFTKSVLFMTHELCFESGMLQLSVSVDKEADVYVYFMDILSSTFLMNFFDNPCDIKLNREIYHIGKDNRHENMA